MTIIIAVLVGLPQLSETVYTPSLPSIAKDMATTNAMAEHTLTIYLFGFAVGTLFGGRLSDNIGRKPCVILGMSIFILGCFGCYFADNITLLMISRFIQAFGGSISANMGQAMCRDAFAGKTLGKVFSSAVSAMAVFPAIGPIIGGFIEEHLTWHYIFLFLIIVAFCLMLAVHFLLPETHDKSKRSKTVISDVATKLIRDEHAIGCALVVGAAQGISFSYFAEGAFVLMDSLGLSPTYYGMTFTVIALATMLGGIFSSYLHNTKSAYFIAGLGIKIVTIASSFSTTVMLIHYSIARFPNIFMICTIVLVQMCIRFGICMIISNCLAMSLVKHKQGLGTASSLFGFFYGSLISLVTFFMGLLHNGSLLPMPAYFMLLSFIMLAVHRFIVRDINAD